MKMKLKEITITILTILINIYLSYMLNTLFFKADLSNFSMVSCGFVAFSLLTINLISKKLGYQLDIFITEIKDNKFIILNNIFIGDLFSIPLLMFLSLFL